MYQSLKLHSLRYLLLLLLLGSQWAVAVHDAESLGTGHSHTLECAVCTLEHNTVSVSPSFGFLIGAIDAVYPLPETSQLYLARGFEIASARAPPVFQ